MDTEREAWHLTYWWWSGPIPPPYQRHITIQLDSDGSGSIELACGEDGPRSSESFLLDGEAFDRLYDVMVRQGLFTVQWREEKSTRFGGPLEYLSVIAQGESIEIPALLPSDQAMRAGPIIEALRQSVPKVCWDTLHKRERAYEEAQHGRAREDL